MEDSTKIGSLPNQLSQNQPVQQPSQQQTQIQTQQPQQNTIVSHNPPLQSNYNPNITQSHSMNNEVQQNQQQGNGTDFSQVLSSIGPQPIHTGLPIRDVQQTTDHLMTDQQQQVNYVGDTNQQKYIQGDIGIENAIQQANKDDKKTNLENKIIDELQTPIIIMFLFFVFQMPFVENKLLHYLPFLFTKEKNLSIKGLIFKVLLFGGSYYVLNKVVQKVIEM